jgi:hypothetical protein
MLTALLLMGYHPANAAWLAVAFYAGVCLLLWWGA